MSNTKLSHSPEPVEAGGVSLREIGRTLRHGLRLIAGVAVGTVALAALATVLVRPSYQGEAVLQLGTRGARSGLVAQVPQLADLGFSGLGGPEIDTDIGVLRSRSIAETVVDSLALHVRLAAPAAPRDSVLRVIHASAEAPEAELSLRHRGGGRYALRVESERPLAAPGEVEIGQPFRVGDAVELVLEPVLRADPPGRIEVAVADYRETVQELQEALRVRRESGRSSLVEIRYRSPDRLLAADVLNTAATAFLDYKVRTSKTESRSTVRVLREQVASYETQLREMEDRLERFRTERGVVNLGAQAATQLERIAEFQVQWDALQVEREALVSLMAELDRADGGAARDSTAVYRRLAGFPALLTNGAIQDMLQSLVELENQRSELLVRRTPQSIDVQGIDRRIRELELQLRDIGRNYLSSLDRQVAASRSKLASFDADLARLPETELELARMEREYRLLGEVYRFLQTRLKEAEIEEAVELGDVRVVDDAIAPEKPVFPKPWLNLSLAAVLGLLLGVTVVVGRAVVGNKIHSPEDAEAAAGGLPVLGSIPQLTATTENARRRGLRRARRSLAVPMDELITRGAAQHPAADAYRALRTNLLFAGAEQAPRTLVVTSTSPGDGRSASVANLAISFAQQGARTLLIDGDLRRGTLHQLFRIRAEPGLTDVLLGRARLEDAVQPIQLDGSDAVLDLLPVGTLPPNPTELLGSAAMRELLAELRGRYQTTLVDAPPLGAAMDAAVLGAAADATLMVARAGSTDRELFRSAVASLKRLRIPISGIVLNDVRPAADVYAGYAAENGRER